MYLCTELLDGVCQSWVEYQPFLALPEGAGLKIGGSLLLVSIIAWGMSHTSRFILNR